MTGFFPNHYKNISGKCKGESLDSHTGDSLVEVGGKGGIKESTVAYFFNPLVNWTGEGNWDEWLLSPFPFINFFSFLA